MQRVHTVPYATKKSCLLVYVCVCVCVTAHMGQPRNLQGTPLVSFLYFHVYIVIMEMFIGVQDPQCVK